MIMFRNKAEGTTAYIDTENGSKVLVIIDTSTDDVITQFDMGNYDVVFNAPNGNAKEMMER